MTVECVCSVPVSVIGSVPSKGLFFSSTENMTWERIGRFFIENFSSVLERKQLLSPVDPE